MRQGRFSGPRFQGRVWFDPDRGEYLGNISGHGSTNPVPLGDDYVTAFNHAHYHATGRRYRMRFVAVDGYPGCFMVEGTRL